MLNDNLFFKQAFDIAPNPIFIYSAEQIIYANKTALELMQVTNINDLIGKNFAQFVHPDYLQIATQDLKKLFGLKQSVIKSHLKIITLQKNVIEVEVSTSLIEYNNKPAIIGIANNITEIKSLNKKLIEYEKKLTSIIKQISHLLFIVSRDGYIKDFFNQHQLPLYKKPEDFLNKNIEEIFLPQLADKIRAKIYALNTTKQNQQLEYTLNINNVEKDFQAFFINFNEDELLVSVIERNKEDYIFKKLFIESHAIQLIIDPDNGKIINANHAAEEFYGYSHEELISMNIKQINVLSPKEVQHEMQNAKYNKQNFFYFKHKTKDGCIKDVIVKSDKIILNNKEFLNSFIYDNTQYKIIQKKYENLFNNLIEAYALHEIIVDEHNTPVDYRYLDVNKAFLSLTQSKSKEEIIGKTVMEIWPKTEKYWIDIFGKVALTGQKISFEHYWQVLDRWYLVNAYSPEKYKFAVSFIDITQLKNNQQKLEILQQALNQAPATIIITDKNGIIEYVNPYFTQLTGYTQEEAKGLKPSILKSEYQNKEFYGNLWKTIKNGKTWQGEFYNKRKDGTFYWENASISPITDINGNIHHFVAVKINITENKILTQQLQEAKEKAEQSDRLKTNFLANISHEVRTPLNTIIGFTELLKNAPTTEQERMHYLEIISQSSERLLNLINDLLEISKIDSGVISIEENTFDLGNEFEIWYQNFLPQAQQKNLTLFLNPVHPKQLNIQSDKNKMLSIISNLVSNAIKYTHQGYVEFGYALKGNIVEITVNDTGIGIPKNKQKAVFERFVQADTRTSKPYEGVGLGLSIVKSYVDIMQGTIELHSNEGKGTKFIVRLPIKFAQPSTNEIIINEESKQISFSQILIVEDDPSSRELLKIFLEKFSKQIITVQNAKEAIEIVKKQIIPIIFSDIKLPDMNGFDLLKEIKKHSPHSIVIGQSGFAMEEDIKNALNQGFDFYITKPISQDTIAHVLNDITKSIKK